MAGEGDTERLVILLEARTRDLERNMQRASNTTGSNFRKMQTQSRSATRQMETDMARSTTRMNQMLASTSTQIGTLGRTMVAGFAGGMLAGGLAGFTRGVRGVVSELSEMGKQIDRVGLSAKAFQELRFGFELAGVSASEFTTGMEQFTRRIGEAATRGGRLAEILKANGVAIRDQNGQVRSSEALLRDYARLIQNAGSEQERMTLATEGFGRGGAAFVNALKDGEQGLDNMAKAAEEAGGTIDESLIRKAEELDDRWAASWRNFEVNAKSAVMNVISYIDDLQARADEFANNGFFRSLAANLPSWGGADLTYLDPDLARARGQALGPDARVRDAFGDSAEAALSDADAALISELQKRYGKVTEAAASTIIPGSSDRGGGGRGSRNRAADAALREAEAVQKLIDNLSHELSLINMSDVEKAKANALRQAGSAATEEQRRQIEELVTAIHSETEALRANEEAQQARSAAIENMFQMGTNALTSIVDGSMKAEEAIKRLAVELALAAAQAALLGTGPLAGIFGRSPAASFSPTRGGFASMLGLPGFATGTANTGGARGEPRGVVHGQEAVIPLPSGGRVPVQLQGGGGETRVKVDVGVSVDSDGNLQAYVRNVAQETANDTTRRGIEENNRGERNRLQGYGVTVNRRVFG